jgi:hypothetical protein
LVSPETAQVPVRRVGATVHERTSPVSASTTLTANPVTAEPSEGAVNVTRTSPSRPTARTCGGVVGAIVGIAPVTRRNSNSELTRV